MNNKTCLITGVNSGIGKQAAIQLAQAGFHVIIGGARNQERGKTAFSEIKVKSKSTEVKLLEIEMSSNKSIFGASKELNQRLESLDAIIHKAENF